MYQYSPETLKCEEEGERGGERGEEERESGREGECGVPFNVSFSFRLRHENNQLHDLLDLRDKEHHSAIAKLHQQHQETIQKVCVCVCVLGMANI